MLRGASGAVRRQLLKPQVASAGAVFGACARRAVAVRSVRGFASIGALLDQVTYEIPLKEALQYSKGKEKWTRADIKLAADGLAAGFLDLQLQPGDTIVAWLGPEDVDLHITQFAAAKAGLTLAVVDLGVSKEALARTLADTGAKALIYSPTIGHTDTTAVLKGIIPELAEYDDDTGVKFRSRKFPALKYLVHTGFDVITGVENLKHIFLPLEPELSPVPAVQSKLTDSTPLYLPIGADGSKGNVLSHADVLKKNAWPVVASVVNKKFLKL